jgi:hypothetical protein
MKFTRFAVSAAAALAFASGAFASMPAGTPIVLQMVGPGQYAGSFSGSEGTNIFDLNLTGVSQVTALLTANSILGQGYNIAGATFDGNPFTPVVDVTTSVGSVDYWTFGPAPVTGGSYTLVVSGLSGGGGGFTGSISVTAGAVQPPPIPEPGSYAMMLAGLGVVGFIAARRRQRGG